MSRNIIIVESENDKYFLQALIEYLDKNIDVEISGATCIQEKIDDKSFRCLGGISKLDKELEAIEDDITKGNIDRVGVIFDADDKSIQKRVKLINDSINSRLSVNLNIEETNRFYKSNDLDVEFACYITNVDGRGELETLLKAIKSEESHYADCLKEWKECVESRSGETISQKDFDKFWISNYLLFDTCSNKEKKQKSSKCSFEYGCEKTMKKPIWDFDNPLLDELKTFLRLFN